MIVVVSPIELPGHRYQRYHRQSRGDQRAVAASRRTVRSDRQPTPTDVGTSGPLLSLRAWGIQLRAHTQRRKYKIAYGTYMGSSGRIAEDGGGVRSRFRAQREVTAFARNQSVHSHVEWGKYRQNFVLFVCVASLRQQLFRVLERSKRNSETETRSTFQTFVELENKNNVQKFGRCGDSNYPAETDANGSNSWLWLVVNTRCCNYQISPCNFFSNLHHNGAKPYMSRFSICNI